MTYLTTEPQMTTAAAADVARIGSAIGDANAAAAGRITAWVAAAADEVSAATAILFGSYAREYQTIMSQAAALHDRFVQALTGAASAYLDTEAANAAVALNTLTATVRSLLGRPASRQCQNRRDRTQRDDGACSNSHHRFGDGWQRRCRYRTRPS
ncbi:PE domain-containing protein [Mycobacterium ostraviense]|uniref:PE domain-containing protein n=1 Tax=Mycobacterium ostraviense TaxID=2738409 RepID=A0A162DVM2_9MYCO|nr:PE domain-containing protein [Mycobacterium ostraviense]KZS58998.1 hypothetical protein A4G28_15115 [Mycobacterium ostraviense]